MSKRVVCAGVIVADHLSKPIDHLPAAGELVAADELILASGGCAANCAIDLAKLGVRATVCGKVGADVFGDFLRSALAREGVDASGLALDPTLPTSQTLIVNVKGEDRRFIHSFGANRSLSVADLESVLTPPPAVLYIGGYLILPGLEPNALARRLESLRAGGTKVLLDVVAAGPGDHLSILDPVLPHLDVFLPNEDEARLILGAGSPFDHALEFQRRGAERVVITRGGAGAVLADPSGLFEAAAFKVDFVDGTGGGDAFDAGYIAGLLDGLDAMGSVRLASALGASCVRAVGATAGVFNRAEAEAFLRDHPLTITRVGPPAERR